MKRIWFGIGLMILLLFLGIGSNFVMERNQSAQSEKLNRAARLAADGDWAAARTLVADARQQWEKKQLLISALCSQQPMDEVDGLFSRLEVFSDARSATSFSSTCVDLACLLESLGESHNLRLHHFF